MDETCITCRYAITDGLGTTMCVCAESEACADWVTADDYCGCWEDNHDQS